MADEQILVGVGFDDLGVAQAVGLYEVEVDIGQQTWQAQPERAAVTYGYRIRSNPG